MKNKTVMEAVKDYIEYRHNLGYGMRYESTELYCFARYVDKIGYKGPITAELALQWAQLPQDCQPVYRARRLYVVRRFTKYMKLLIPETEIPPKGILGASYYRRITPHIYSEDEVITIMRTARNLKRGNKLRPHIYATLFGLLYSTGMRISEALNLMRTNVDLVSGTITIVEGKFHKSRLVPVHPTTVEALKSYVVKRDKKYPVPKTKNFFVNEYGKSLRYHSVHKIFNQIISDGDNETSQRRPRIHDIRHTFAARKLLEWYRNGDDVHQKMSFLSNYLGHAKVANTYWYLTAVPELMAIAAFRFEKFAYNQEGK